MDAGCSVKALHKRRLQERVQNYLIIFLFFLVNFFCFVRLLGLRGRAGEREGRREGGGWIFPWETLIPSHF